MRNYVITLCISLLSFGTTEAQRSIRLGYVDMNYILENVPEYKEAQAQLDNKVAGWKNEIEKRNKEIDQMRKTLENERVLLTQELIKEREDEIRFMQNEILDYQQKRFGPEGDLIKQRSVLVEPIQDQVFNAVQEIAKARQYDFVLDKSSELVMLYADKRHDISDQILLSIKRSSKRNQINSRADKQELEEDLSYVIKKLDFLKEEFNRIMDSDPVSHYNYPNSRSFYKKIKDIFNEKKYKGRLVGTSCILFK